MFPAVTQSGFLHCDIVSPVDKAAELNLNQHNKMELETWKLSQGLDNRCLPNNQLILFSCGAKNEMETGNNF